MGGARLHSDTPRHSIGMTLRPNQQVNGAAVLKDSICMTERKQDVLGDSDAPKLDETEAMLREADKLFAQESALNERWIKLKQAEARKNAKECCENGTRFIVPIYQQNSSGGRFLDLPCVIESVGRVYAVVRVGSPSALHRVHLETLMSCENNRVYPFKDQGLYAAWREWKKRGDA